MAGSIRIVELLFCRTSSGLAIEARYAPAEDESTEVTDAGRGRPGDARRSRRSSRSGWATRSTVRMLKDFDKRRESRRAVAAGNRQCEHQLGGLSPDGRPDLRARWRAERRFAGEDRDSGYIAAAGPFERQPITTSSFFKLEPDELKSELTARVAGELDAQGEKVVSAECAIEEGADLAALGLTADAAKAQFCAEPTVDGLVTDMLPSPPTASSSAACVERGIAHFKEIGSYRRRSDGRDSSAVSFGAV